MRLAEGANGLHALAMAFPLGDGQAIAVKFYHARAGIGNFQHNAGKADRFAADLALCLWKFHAGMDGVFQGIGKNNGQFSLIDLELIGQGDSRIDLDPLPLRLLKIGGEGGIEHCRLAPAHRFCFVQPLLRRVKELQCRRAISAGDQRSHRLQAVADIVPLDADAFLKITSTCLDRQVKPSRHRRERFPCAAFAAIGINGCYERL